MEGIALFNAKPKKGIRALQGAGLVGPTPGDVARFLKTAEGLDYASVGILLSEPDEESRQVRRGVLLGIAVGLVGMYCECMVDG